MISFHHSFVINPDIISDAENRKTVPPMSMLFSMPILRIDKYNTIQSKKINKTHRFGYVVDVVHNGAPKQSQQQKKTVNDDL